MPSNYTVEVRLMHFVKARNSTKVPSGDEVTTTTICYIKEQTSVLAPVIMVGGNETTFGGDQYPDYNYAYIPDFNRYYYVRNVENVSALLWYISLEVDVLATYREQILNTNAFVLYAQNGYDVSIPDTRLPKTTKRTAFHHAEHDIPTFDEDGAYLLTAISQNGNGENGMATTYVMNKTTLGMFGAVLSTIDFLDKLIQQFTDPFDCIVSCTWIPVSLDRLVQSSARANIMLGPYDTEIAAYVAPSVVRAATTLPFTLPYINTDGTYTDYRNVEPYTEMRVSLPGIGLVQLPLSRIVGSDTPALLITYRIDVATGGITYKISNRYSDAILLTVSGNIGVELPVSSSSMNAAGLIGATVTAGVSLVAGAIAPVAGVLGAGMALSQALDASQVQNHIKGALGGRDAVLLNTQFSIIVDTWEISESPANIARTLGRPVMKMRRLGWHTGLVRASGAFVECDATQDEMELISTYVNTSTNHMYDGGLIIE